MTRHGRKIEIVSKLGVVQFLFIQLLMRTPSTIIQDSFTLRMATRAKAKTFLWRVVKAIKRFTLPQRSRKSPGSLTIVIAVFPFSPWIDWVTDGAD